MKTISEFLSESHLPREQLPAHVLTNASAVRTLAKKHGFNPRISVEKHNSKPDHHIMHIEIGNVYGKKDDDRADGFYDELQDHHHPKISHEGCGSMTPAPKHTI